MEARPDKMIRNNLGKMAPVANLAFCINKVHWLSENEHIRNDDVQLFIDFQLFKNWHNS